MNIVLSDKIIQPHLPDDYLDCSNEGEAIAIACGHYLATGERANVYLSADGFCNALNAITSWVMPDGIEMNIYISAGRTEKQHKVMSAILPELLELLNYDAKKLFIATVWK